MTTYTVSWGKVHSNGKAHAVWDYIHPDLGIDLQMTRSGACQFAEQAALPAPDWAPKCKVCVDLIESVEFQIKKQEEDYLW